ncbi:MAG: ComEA family DNA-binding protein [Thiotrichales bacterium]
MKKGLVAITFAALFGMASALVAAPVDVNSADAQAIAAGLNGIGPAKVPTIVEYRAAYGPFKNLADLEKVPGVRTKILEKNRDNLVFKQPAPEKK